MRVSKEKAAENRERILTEAARLFRERGLGGVGVDALADAAGLTHGGLYSQFGSKERLAAEALAHALAASAARSDKAKNLPDFVDRYLSTAHRDAPGGGCALAALGCEVPRHAGAVRTSFTEGVRRMARRIGALLPATGHRDPEAEALATAATLVGALVLARAVNDPELSDQILTAARGRISPGIAIQDAG